ncbi:MAG: dTMP kinase [Candidatus Peribacteraceae bacterium]|nr:dTMP kinase [Candidatus Peribacteraceae bacterium]
MLGRFIVLEGPDGSGTTTHSAILAETLRAQGEDVVLTAEPTGSPIGRFIREQLSAKSIESPSALQLLFCADRAWHIEKVIKPALAAGKTVISDRYVISTLIYGEALGLDPDWLVRVNTPFLEPDVMIIALPSLHVCLERIMKRKQLDVFENTTFQKLIYDLYEKAGAEDESAIVIDTGGEKDDVAKEILKAVR